MTYIKKSILKWSIARTTAVERLLVEKRHEKKLKNLLKEKVEAEGSPLAPDRVQRPLQGWTVLPTAG